MIFGLQFCTLLDPIIINIKIFCPIFLKLSNTIFEFFEKTELHGARAPFEVFMDSWTIWPWNFGRSVLLYWSGHRLIGRIVTRSNILICTLASGTHPCALTILTTWGFKSNQVLMWIDRCWGAHARSRLVGSESNWPSTLWLDLTCTSLSSMHGRRRSNNIISMVFFLKKVQLSSENHP
jgi:hypothetical protein